jgi:dolichol-phosphate mannosyltransferase
MSGFFGFKRHIINDIEFDAIGYKVLLEILVKTKGARIKEIPYVFTNRKSGSSKLDASVITDYIRAVWRLYRYGNSQREKERRLSVRFLSKAARFYTIGASGVFINYIMSLLSGSVMPDLWYLHASIIGIITSMTSNFFLNKMWTFEDMDFSMRKTLAQYGLFLGFSTIGALVQLAMLFLLVESYGIDYPIALIIAVGLAAVGNFLLNKKWTFKEKIWS